MSAEAIIIRPATGTRLAENALGRTVSADAPKAWRHPWYTTAKWLPKKKAWAAFVVAGFVNGFAPAVRVSAGDLRDARGTFFGQLADARTGAAEIEQLARLAVGGSAASGLADSEMLDVPLYQNPPISLNDWRAIGWDGAEKAPLFFRDRGVNNPPPGVQSQLEGGGKIAMGTLAPPKGNRLLRACDVMLHQPRTALGSEITVSPSGAVSGTTLVSQTLAARAAAAGDKLKIQTGTYEELGQNALDFRGAGSLVADYEEKNWDQLHISTVYLLSPPDAEIGAKPDSTWQVFSAHKQFWNLSWAQPELEAKWAQDIFAQLLGTVAVIGGGSGFTWATSVAASINDATQSAYNILAAQSLAGSFWTATGGGSTSAYPSSATAAASAGLDKAAAAKAKARAEQLAKINRRLDPAFPYEGAKFNTSLLTR